MKIGIAAKLSKIEWDSHRLGISKEDVINLYKKENKDIVRILKSHERQKECIDLISRAAPNAEIIDIISLQNGKAKKKKIDTLIAIGGDNFFQICAYYFENSCLAGVNSDPLTSKGQLLNFTYDTLREHLDAIINGEFKSENWTKIAASLNGKRIKDALCIVSLPIVDDDKMKRYLLKYKGEQEEHKATGILVVSGAGSGEGSWYRSAGLYLPLIGSGLFPQPAREFSKTARQIRTITREPFDHENCPYKWLNLTINEDDELSLIYWASQPAKLSIDSVKIYTVKEGDVLSFRVSEKSLKVVGRVTK